MTTDELNTIVAAVVAELEKSGVDFDYKAEQAEDDDLVFVIRGTAPNYQGVTVTWKGLLDIITAQATQAKNDAETAKNTANTILEQVQSKGTEITNFVATSKAELETQKNESVNAVKSVYQTDLNELKGDLYKYKVGETAYIDYLCTIAGVWAVGKSLAIPVTSSSNVTIKAPTSNECYFAVLKECNPVVGASAVFATGYTSFVKLPKDSIKNINIPSDGNYLLLTSIDSFPYEYAKVDGYDYTKFIRENILDILNDISNVDFIESYITNVYDESENTEGYVVDENSGSIISNSYTTQYAVTSYIPVEYGDIIKLAYVRGKNLCGGALYDSNKNYIKTIWGTDDFIKPSTDVNKAFRFVVNDPKVKYIRYNVLADSLFLRSKQYVKVYRYPSFSSAEKVIHVGSARSGYLCFTTLKECTEYIMSHNLYGYTVYVDAETFDLVSEFTQAYLDSYSISENNGFGLKVGNNTKFVFSPGSCVVFRYVGTNTNASHNFSPFNVIGSVTFVNLKVRVSNARYCIHEDPPTVLSNSLPDNMIVEYIDCDMEHEGGDIAYSAPVCIGGGTIPNGMSKIIGGKYVSIGNDVWHRAISYHNFSTSSYGNHTSKVIVKNAWVSNGLRCGRFGDSNVDMEISGCYIPYGIVEADGFTITSWNNVIN